MDIGHWTLDIVHGHHEQCQRPLCTLPPTTKEACLARGSASPGAGRTGEELLHPPSHQTAKLLTGKEDELKKS